VFKPIRHLAFSGDHFRPTKKVTYYFSGRDEMYKHRVQINAAKYTPMNDQMIVTGELRSVASTPFDFRVPKSLGVAIFQLPRKPVGI
jgi:hypothetical protein